MAPMHHCMVTIQSLSDRSIYNHTCRYVILYMYKYVYGDDDDDCIPTERFIRFRPQILLEDHDR